jgi:hypothetical protein
MMISQLLGNARSLKAGMEDGAIVREVLEPHGQEIVEQQRIQLLEGKGSDGKDLHPFYTEDLKPSGYFMNRDSAQRYAAWKQTLSYPASVRRNPNAPNLYITGVFHDDLNVDFRANEMAIVPDTAYAANIMAKYGFGIFGLCAEKWAVIWDEKGAKDELIKKMKETLWQ